MNQIDRFLSGNYPVGSYHAVLRAFLVHNTQRHVSSSTISRLYYSLQPIGGTLGKSQLASISSDDLDRYVENLWLRYAPDSVRTAIGDIRHFFGWCADCGHLPENVARFIRPIKRRRRGVRSKAAPESDVQQLMAYLVRPLKADLLVRDLFGVLQPAESGWDHAALKNLRDLFILTYLYETGARVGELANLGSRAMNQATARPSRVYTITVVGKTGDRDYHFTERTAELWRAWQIVRPEGANQYAVVGWGHGHNVGRMRSNGISQMIARRSSDAGVPAFRAHSLRHAKVKRARRAVGLEMASILIDHSDLASTWGYASIDDDEIADAVLKTGCRFNLW